MPPSINNLSLTAEPSMLPQYQSFHSYDFETESNYSISITLRSSNVDDPNINAKHLETLKSIEALNDNWDEEDAIAPPSNVTRFTKAMIYLMSAIGQEIYNIAPGPKGEILILFSNDKRSFEVLIYPDKMRYVKFPESGDPLQAPFTIEALYSELLSWLNS